MLANAGNKSDAGGNLTKKDDGTNVQAYKYDFRNLMTDYDGPGSNNDTTYRYHAAGHRVEKTDHTGQSAVTTRWYLDGWSAAEKRDGGDALQATNVNGARLDEYVLMHRNSTNYEPLATHLNCTYT